MQPITLRLANATDAGALERLAQLDSCRLPAGPHLVAVSEGRIDAAISLATGEVVADPFRRTTELCELLRCRARSQRVRATERAVTRGQARPALAT
jgi:hypothetical protein